MLAFNPWKAGNATEEATFGDDALNEVVGVFCNDRAVKLALTAEIDAAAAIGELSTRRSCVAEIQRRI